MTCDEYLAILAATPADEIRRARLPDHAVTCPHCERATRLLVDRERSSVGLDDDLYSNVPAAVPHAALVARRHRVVTRLYRVAVGIMIVGALAFVAAKRMVPVPRLATAQQAILVQCLTADEAGAIARPLLGSNGWMTYRGEAGRGVVTVRGTSAQVNEVAAALDDFEQRSPSCRVPSPTPPARP